MTDDDVGLVPEVLAEAHERGIDVPEAYEITTIIPYADKENEVKSYTKPAEDLDQFFQIYSQTAEIVVNIRPIDDARDDV